MKTQINDKLKEKVEPGFLPELELMLRNGTFGAHGNLLQENLLQNGQPDLLELFDHGLESIAQLAQRPDPCLAAYFLTLSELMPVFQIVRDLALDAMLYCENDADWDVPERKEGLLERYRALRPMLGKQD